MHASVTSSVFAARGALIPLVLGRVGGAAAAGYFAVAQLPITMASVISAPLRIVLVGTQGRLWAEGKIDVLRRGLRAYTLAALGAGVPGAVAGWYLLPWIVPALYSSRFRPAVTPARILLIAAGALLLVGWLKTLPAAVGRPHIRTWLALGELVVTMSLVAALSHRGASGAAAALSAATVLAAVVWYASSRMVLGARGGT
jgi:O-antigen/teichoic acid export membrane protein